MLAVTLTLLKMQNQIEQEQFLPSNFTTLTDLTSVTVAKWKL